MDRTAYNALLAQYRVRELTGDGAVGWDGGVKCVIPEVKLLGKCGQDGTPTPEAPVEIKCNNGTFVINGKNIFNFVPFVDAGYFSVDDEESGECTIIRTDSFPSVPVNAMKNTQYCITFEFQGVLDGQNVIMVVNYTDGTSQSIGGSTDVSQFVTVQALTSANKTIKSISFGASGGIRTGTKLQKVQIEASQAPTPYAPYFDGDTAQAPDLYGIPGTDYQDEWSPQTGQGVRRMKKIVLDGTESSWQMNEGQVADGYNLLWLMNQGVLGYQSQTAIICSHLQTGRYTDQECAYLSSTQINGIVSLVVKTDTIGGDTLEAWRAYLAAQTEAGTPVTVIAASNANTPFESTPSRLIMPSGYGQIIQTGGDVADCPLAVRWLGHQ